LRDNRLFSIPKTIGKLPLLKELDLRGNPIKSLPKELSHLNEITKLG
jgi:Leucine-rich repeat (LRR) protein